MSRLSCAFFLLAGAALLAANGSVHAQGGAETVNIITADGVKLRGAFYPAPAKCLATVIMLHPIGEGKSMKAPEWKNLAESLQKAGYAVFMFDFRGHGDSTEIAQPKEFWTKPQNIANVKTKNKDEIDVKDYIRQGSAYLPILVNDIAAARAYLDRRNDNTKDCNTSSIIVIGADNGATLGAIWMNSEWNRIKYTPPSPMALKGEFAKNPEGSDIIGAVFLSIAPSLEKRPVSVAAILKTACKDKGTAAFFLAGKEDKKNWELTKTLEKKLKFPDDKKHAYIGAGELETNLSGMKLLTKGLKADLAITEYLGNVVEDRKAEWSDHEFDKSFYMWRLPSSGQMVPAKKKGEKTLVFEDYGKFIPQ